jgi:hypothetical protein
MNRAPWAGFGVFEHRQAPDLVLASFPAPRRKPIKGVNQGSETRCITNHPAHGRTASEPSGTVNASGNDSSPKLADERAVVVANSQLKAGRVVAGSVLGDAEVGFSCCEPGKELKPFLY